MGVETEDDRRLGIVDAVAWLRDHAHGDSARKDAVRAQLEAQSTPQHG